MFWVLPLAFVAYLKTAANEGRGKAFFRLVIVGGVSY